MLRSGLDHRDVNIFTWVCDFTSDVLLRSERTEDRGGGGYLSMAEKEENVYEILTQILNYLDDLVVRLQDRDKFFLFCACSANPRLSSQVLSAEKAYVYFKNIAG